MKWFKSFHQTDSMCDRCKQTMKITARIGTITADTCCSMAGKIPVLDNDRFESINSLRDFENVVGILNQAHVLSRTVSIKSI